MNTIELKVFRIQAGLRRCEVVARELSIESVEKNQIPSSNLSISGDRRKWMH